MQVHSPEPVFYQISSNQRLYVADFLIEMRTVLKTLAQLYEEAPRYFSGVAGITDQPGIHLFQNQLAYYADCAGCCQNVK